MSVFIYECLMIIHPRLFSDSNCLFKCFVASKVITFSLQHNFYTIILPYRIIIYAGMSCFVIASYFCVLKSFNTRTVHVV